MRQSSIQMAELAKAKIYFAIGVEFEHALLNKIASVNPKLMIVHTDQGISKIPMKAHHHEGKQAYHEDEGSDPHIWLSPTLVKVQADAIFKALISVDPDRKAV